MKGARFLLILMWFFILAAHVGPVAGGDADSRTDTVRGRRLPLIALPAGNPRDPLVLILSGDGGWAGLDHKLAEYCRDRGFPVLGFDSLRYFWSRKTPDQAAADLAWTLQSYMSSWHRSSVVLIGWSMGADVLPFLINRLPEDLQGKIAYTALLGPSREADFEFHLAEWFSRWRKESGGVPVLPEVLKLPDRDHLVLVCGEHDRDSLCREPGTEGLHIEYLGKGHSFAGERDDLPAKVAGMIGLADP
jgi:type IV secretory pathway VirJ component